MRARTKVLTTVAVAVPLVLLGAGTAYATHYQDRALPGSSVAGVPVAGMTRAEVAAAVQRRADQVTITLDTGEVTRTAHLADLGYAVDVQPTVDAVFRPTSRGRPTPARWSPPATSRPCCTSTRPGPRRWSPTWSAAPDGPAPTPA